MSYFSSYIMLNCYVGKRRCRRLLRDGDDDKRLTNVLHQFFCRFQASRKVLFQPSINFSKTMRVLTKAFTYIYYLYQTIRIQKYSQNNSYQRNIKSFLNVTSHAEELFGEMKIPLESAKMNKKFYNRKCKCHNLFCPYIYSQNFWHVLQTFENYLFGFPVHVIWD